MASTVSDINALLAGRSSDIFTGGTSSGSTVSGFHGELDRAMQQDPVKESLSDVRTVVEETGAGLSEEAREQAASPPANGEKPDLSPGEQNSEISTVDQSYLDARTTKQKVSDIEDALENGGGLNFLSELKDLLLFLSNCDLDNLSLDGAGLEALGDLLVQAGFDPASVEELMSDLTLALDAGSGLISVSGFMDELFKLPLAGEEDITRAEALMPTSDMPYIKSILAMMGVGEQEIASIMDEASEGPRGFDFEAFIEQLEQLLATAGESGTVYKTDGGNDAYTTLLKQLGLDFFIEESDGPLTLATLIDAFSQKFDLIKNSVAGQTGQPLSDMFTTNPFDALATLSGRHGLLNQLFSGLNIQDGSGTAAAYGVTHGPGSDAMVKEIKERFQVQFMDQVSGGNLGTKTAVQAAGNTASADIQTGQADSDGAFKIASSFSDTTGTTRESASQVSIKAAEAAALEKMAAAANSQPGDSPSKGSGPPSLVFGVERSATMANAGTSGTQRTHQTFSALPDFVTRQVGKSIVRSINTGDDTIRMQLKPPELGRVYMSIDHNGSAMKVSVITEHQSAKDILAANVNEIKTMLSSSGISLESFEVDMSSDFQQSMADARTRDQSAGKQQAKNRAGDDARDDGSDNLNVQTVDTGDSGSLHFVA